MSTTEVAPKAHELEQAGQIFLWPVEQVRPSPDNPRQDVGDVSGMAATMKKVGVLEPLIVGFIQTDEDGTDYVELVAGERRLAAAKLAGLDRVPCIHRQRPDGESVLPLMLIENGQRLGLTELEEAAAYQRLYDEEGMSQAQIAEQCGVSQGHVSKRLSLLNLSKPARTRLAKGSITTGEALALAKLPAERQSKALQEPGSLDGAIRRHTREVALEEKIDQARKAANDAGVALIEWDDLAMNVTAASNPMPLHRLHGSRQLPDDHTKADCHAVSIRPTNADVVEVCTDPKSHPEAQLELQAEDREAAAEQKAIKAADEARWAACAHAAQHAPRAAALIHAVRRLVGSWGGGFYRGTGYPRACDLLNLSRGDDDHQAAVVEYANASTDNAMRALLALVLGSDDIYAINGHIVARNVPIVETHFAFIANHSDWEPSEIEKQALAKALKQRQERDQ